MIVLHVARARTDSINIRGSLGKTPAALWITVATFLYFSECNAHTPFTLFSFLRLSRLPQSFLSRYFSFTIFPYPPVIVSPFLSFTRAPCLLLFPPVHTRHCAFSLSFSISFLTHLHPRFPLVEQMDRLVTLELFPRSELLFPRPKWKLSRYPIPGSYTRETELSDNPLICPVITSHWPSSI